MKILFVASGNSPMHGIEPFIQSQAESLRREGIEVTNFPVTGKGVPGYLRSAVRLRGFLKNNQFDVLHAHYSLCGWVALLASQRMPLVLSLMGSDVHGISTENGKVRLRSWLLYFFTWSIQPFVRAIVTKSEELRKAVYRKNISHVIPNGVRLDQFRLSPGGFREELGLSPEKKYVLFLGDIGLARKNFSLAKKAVELLGRPDVVLLNIFSVPHGTVVKYLNSADVFVLTSFAEGSPNVVKEAMACNCPLVVTDVGDTTWVVGDTPGCFVASHDPGEFSVKLAAALDFAEKNGRTRGRKRIVELGLDARTIAHRLIKIYSDLLQKQAPSFSKSHADG